MRCVLFIVALAGLATFSLAIPYVYDELLYTKQLWDEYKLDFPYSIFKDDDDVITRAKDTLTGLFLEDSLSGPQSNLQELIDQDLKRGEFQPNSFDVSLIEDTTPIPGAASVAQCKTCLALAAVMWDGLVQWTHRYMGSVAAHDLIPYGESLCEYEVPEVVLKDWVLLSARVHSSPDHPAQQFYMLSVRHRQHARVREIQVVRAACKALLSNKHAESLEQQRDLTTDDIFRMEASPLLEIISKKQKEYLAALKQQGATPVEKTESNSSTIPTEDTIPGLDDVDNGDALESVEIDNDSKPSAPLPKVQRECFNKHPQCEYWAERGECKANPGYMVGTETNGWCRAACFVCPHPTPITPGGELSATALGDLEQISTDLLDAVKTEGCTKSSPCRFINGNDAAKGRLASAAGVDPEKTAALQQAALISGPIEAESGDGAIIGNAPGAAGTTARGGSSTTSASETKSGQAGGIDRHFLDESMVFTILPIDKAVVPKPKNLKKEEILKYAPEKDASLVEKALWEEIGGQCLYTNGGWWSYEVCYLHSVTQFHMPGGQSGPDWTISLGEFASTNWEIRNITNTHGVQVGVGLFPVESVVPYVSQLLESGNVCELTGETGVNSLGISSNGGDNNGGDHGHSGGDQVQQGTGAPGTVAENDGSSTAEATSATSLEKSKIKNIGGQVLRTTLIRFMCSPDMNKNIAVVEPEQCRYVVDVYVPALCRIKGMAPVLPPPPKVEVSEKKRDSSSSSLDHRMDIDFDDPYVDPDELEELEMKRKAKKENKKKESTKSRKDEL